LWLIWEFSANKHYAAGLTVRPPRLGGNERVGVFASRSPFRPNRLGLTSVEISRIDCNSNNAPIIYVKGADLMDGTPIFDIKPYVAYADSHPDACSGFVDKTEWNSLKVVIPEDIKILFNKEELLGLEEVLSFDPRPQYHNDPTRIYGMPFAGKDILFRVDDDILTVVGVK
jgi:hypothetical protein